MLSKLVDSLMRIVRSFKLGPHPARIAVCRMGRFYDVVPEHRPANPVRNTATMAVALIEMHTAGEAVKYPTAIRPPLVNAPWPQHGVGKPSTICIGDTLNLRISVRLVCKVSYTNVFRIFGHFASLICYRKA